MPNTWIMALAVAGGVSAVLIVLLAFTNLPFYFMNGKQIEVAGHFVNCAPTRILDVCYMLAFRDTSGKYYVVTNLQQIMESNPDLFRSIQAIDSKTNNDENNNAQFHILGVFSYGSPVNYETADVVGGIEATSIIEGMGNGGVGKIFKVNDLLIPYAGIDNDTAVVRIKNQKYYMTTVQDFDISQIPRGYNISFHNVTFRFPYGSYQSPGGVFLVFEVTYPDGSIEKFGSVSEGAAQAPLYISSLPGAYVPNTQTVLGKHQNPNIGLTVHNKGEQIKLLVSKE